MNDVGSRLGHIAGGSAIALEHLYGLNESNYRLSRHTTQR